MQPQKTEILAAGDFEKVYLQTVEDRELDGIRDRFKEFAQEIGLDTLYEPIEYDDLTDEQQDFIDSLNLRDMLREELEAAGGPDFTTVSFVLRRLRQLGTSDVVDLVLDNVEALYPVLPDVVRYLADVRDLQDDERKRVGRRLVELVLKSILRELEYYRMWVLELFAGSGAWNCVDMFHMLMAELPDPLSRRKLILAMGRAHQQYWFQARRRNLFDEGEWQRRALLAAASSMPADACEHWYRSLEPKLDPLERAVVKWAKQNPFRD